MRRAAQRSRNRPRPRRAGAPTGRAAAKRRCPSATRGCCLRRRLDIVRDAAGRLRGAAAARPGGAGFAAGPPARRDAVRGGRGGPARRRQRPRAARPRAPSRRKRGRVGAAAMADAPGRAALERSTPGPRPRQPRSPAWTRCLRGILAADGPRMSRWPPCSMRWHGGDQQAGEAERREPDRERPAEAVTRRPEGSDDSGATRSAAAVRHRPASGRSHAAWRGWASPGPPPRGRRDRRAAGRTGCRRRPGPRPPLARWRSSERSVSAATRIGSCVAWAAVVRGSVISLVRRDVVATGSPAAPARRAASAAVSRKSRVRGAAGSACAARASERRSS